MKKLLKMFRCPILLFGAMAICCTASADLITVANPGFEDTSGQTTFNEFTFGTPAGWTIHDPVGAIGAGFFTGTLEPNGVDFFNGPAPEGIKVSILFNSAGQGTGEYGYEQSLADVLTANTNYTLSVDVGNIASGFSQDGTFFDLSEFPGYRVELLAGDQVIASDNNSHAIAEGEFETATVQFTTGSSHALLGQALGIRLVNLNEIPDGFTQQNSPDLEVDFDNVRLDATSIPEPTGLIFACGLVCFCMTKRPTRTATRI